MSGLLDRPKLTRESLKSHNIVYHENIIQDSDSGWESLMPDHVNILRKVLLKISRIRVLEDFKDKLRKEEVDLRQSDRWSGIDISSWELQPPTSAYTSKADLQQSYKGWREEIEMIRANIHEFRIISQEAIKLKSDPESGWINFYRTKLFKKFEIKQASDAKDDQ